MKKIEFVLLFLGIILAISILLIMFWDKIMFKSIYYFNFNINLPLPKTQDELYHLVGRDPTSFQILMYDKKSFNKIKNQKYIKRVNVDKVNKLLNELLPNEQGPIPKKIMEKYFDQKLLINQDNYYALIKQDDSENSDFLFLLLDTKNLKVYSFCVYN